MHDRIYRQRSRDQHQSSVHEQTKCVGDELFFDGSVNAFFVDVAAVVAVIVAFVWTDALYVPVQMNFGASVGEMKRV